MAEYTIFIQASALSKKLAAGVIIPEQSRIPPDHQKHPRPRFLLPNTRMPMCFEVGLCSLCNDELQIPRCKAELQIAVAQESGRSRPGSTRLDQAAPEGEGREVTPSSLQRERLVLFLSAIMGCNNRTQQHAQHMRAQSTPNLGLQGWTAKILQSWPSKHSRCPLQLRCAETARLAFKFLAGTRAFTVPPLGEHLLLLLLC